jgi:hypothetical protein
MTPSTLAPVAISNGSTMTARDRVTEFLVATPRALCDACVARALAIDPSTAYRAAMKITRSAGFVRRYGACSECSNSRLLTCVCR